MGGLARLSSNQDESDKQDVIGCLVVDAFNFAAWTWTGVCLCDLMSKRPQLSKDPVRPRRGSYEFVVDTFLSVRAIFTDLLTYFELEFIPVLARPPHLTLCLMVLKNSSRERVGCPYAMHKLWSVLVS